MQAIRKNALALSVIAAVGFAAPAQAATDSTAVTVSGTAASLTPPTFGDFAGVTLNGSAQTTTTSVANWAVNDSSGTGAGWEVSVSASQLQTGDVTPVAMSGATLTLSAPTVAATDSTNTSTPPTVVGGDILAGTVKVADANSGGGMGAWDLTQGATHLALKVPANAKAGSYTSTITTTLATGV